MSVVFFQERHLYFFSLASKSILCDKLSSKTITYKKKIFNKTKIKNKKKYKSEKQNPEKHILKKIKDNDNSNICRCTKVTAANKFFIWRENYGFFEKRYFQR